MAKVVGFFTKQQLHSVGIDGPSCGECEECQLYKSCKTPRMEVTGKGGKGILIVSGAPGSTEDRTGVPMSGKSGLFLRKKLKEKGINLEEDCWYVKSVACYPGKDGNGKPKKINRKWVKSCRPRVEKAIEDLKPRHIWLFGDEAITSHYMERESNCSAGRWRAICIPDPDNKAWVVPMYHPAFAIRNEKDDHLQMVWDRDLSFAVKCARFNDPPEHVALGKCVTILKTYDDVIRELEKVLQLLPSKLAHDYEATGLKPYLPQHKVASISFCYQYDRAFSFPYEYRKHFTVEQLDHIADLWSEILTHPKIKKIAHNSKFEDMWAREIYAVEPNMWWCTMNTAHILDNRTEFTGLKFQALIRWGIPDYDSSIEKYLKSVDGTPFNRIMEAPLNDLLLYGGIDSLLTFRLQEEQEEELEPFLKMQKAREFFMGGLNTLCDIQENGIQLNTKYYDEQDKLLTQRISEMKAALYKFPEAVKFERIKKRPINFGSSQDLASLFFDVLGLPKGKQTAGGNDCVDAGVLAELNTPIAKEITKISKLEKIQGTYLGQFKRECDAGDKMHPFFDLHIPQTFRGSSSRPNFQNIPVRDEEAKNITRAGIVPSVITNLVGQSFYNERTKATEIYQGNKLLDWDYGAMEVRIIACYTQDPVLMSYIHDVTTDMHRDMAKEIFAFGESTWDAIPKKQAKMLRFEGKNGATFPWFYGSYFKSIARGLFAKCMEMTCYDNTTVFEHLQAMGIIKTRGTKAYDEFEAHIKKVEERFWHKFKYVKQWQEKAWKDYLRLGYIEQMFGFRCSGWLTRNDVVNYPVQGSAFHCLMWAIGRILEEMKAARMLSRMNGQIHDCCLTDLFPPEQQALMVLSEQIAMKEIREVHKWINVPLLIEWEETEVNGGWNSKKEIHL